MRRFRSRSRPRFRVVRRIVRIKRPGHLRLHGKSALQPRTADQVAQHLCARSGSAINHLSRLGILRIGKGIPLVELIDRLDVSCRFVKIGENELEYISLEVAGRTDPGTDILFAQSDGVDILRFEAAVDPRVACVAPRIRPCQLSW